MYNFQHDYAEGAHPDILKKLVETNLVQQVGYGEDEYSLQAKALIRQKVKNDKAAIYFVSGGTQANLMVISALLKTHEGVISAETGHISSNETGAIEAVGHKVMTIQTADGKLAPEHIQKVQKVYSKRPHVLKPKMVYISNSTEIGTIYSKAELTALSAYCRANGLILFLDGARLGSALTAKENDLTLPEISALTDVFYIGGTKNGALLGEAIVFNDPELAPEFDYVVKQKGAMLAKGRLLGIQFLELFKGELFLELAQHANDMATMLAEGMSKKGVDFYMKHESNQLFPILSNERLNRLRNNFLFHDWVEIDEQHTAIRLVTSWATLEEEVVAFLEEL